MTALFPDIYVIVPSFNEEKVVRVTVEKLLQEKYIVVVVDDASGDNTRKALSGLPVYYIRHSVNLGQGAALHTGIRFALKKKASYIATFDADGQHDVADIEKMSKLLKSTGAGIVFGSRFLEGATTNMNRSRRTVLKVARLINYFFSGLLLTDANNGIRLMTNEAAKKIQITENRSTHSAQIQRLVKLNKIEYAECSVNVSYSDYSRKKGLKNSASIRILYELILFKIFR